MWDDAKALAALAATLGGMAAIALLAAAVLWLARQPLFAIREVVLATPPVRARAPHLSRFIRGHRSDHSLCGTLVDDRDGTERGEDEGEHGGTPLGQ